VWRFKIVDIFGKSILTAEDGVDWKRHHKIVGPSFSERSNRLVFEESLRQAEGMLSFWAQKSKTDAVTDAVTDELKISDTSGDTGTLTLHVICAAGFGIPQLWENQNAEKLGKRAIPGFSDDRLTGTHTVSFKKSLTTILSHILWFMVIPPRILRKP
jgi:cytochrome P450